MEKSASAKQAAEKVCCAFLTGLLRQSTGLLCLLRNKMLNVSMLKS